MLSDIAASRSSPMRIYVYDMWRWRCSEIPNKYPLLDDQKVSPISSHDRMHMIQMRDLAQMTGIIPTVLSATSSSGFKVDGFWLRRAPQSRYWLRHMLWEMLDVLDVFIVEARGTARGTYAEGPSKYYGRSDGLNKNVVSIVRLKYRTLWEEMFWVQRHNETLSGSIGVPALFLYISIRTSGECTETIESLITRNVQIMK